MPYMKKLGRPKKEKPVAKTKKQLIENLLESGECVLSGIGTFDLRKIPERKYRDRWTGNLVTQSEYIKIGFKPEKSLSEAIQSSKNYAA